MATEVVDAQVDAYNRHDLEAFLARYSSDVTIRTGQGDALMAGINAVRRQYGDLSGKHRDRHVDVLGQLVAGPWVVDQEQVTTGDATIHWIAATTSQTA